MVKEEMGIVSNYAKRQNRFANSQEGNTDGNGVKRGKNKKKSIFSRPNNPISLNSLSKINPRMDS